MAESWQLRIDLDRAEGRQSTKASAVIFTWSLPKLPFTGKTKHPSGSGPCDGEPVLHQFGQEARIINTRMAEDTAAIFSGDGSFVQGCIT
jgi:hypothetical protein